MSAPDQPGFCSTSAWIRQARAAIEAAAPAWPTREADAVRTALRGLVRAIRTRAGRTIRLPLALPRSWLLPLHRLPAHQAWAAQAPPTGLDRPSTTRV